MRRLISFSQVSLDGFFADKNGDMSWAHKDSTDAEWKAFVEGNASGGGVMLFGRVTYELMASYWPTQFAAKNDPIVAERMNHLPKVVFSRTISKASWQNTTVVKGELCTEIRDMKKNLDTDMAILGSGSIISQLTNEGLIDEYHIVVNPIVLGKGRTLFEGVKDTLALRLVNSRTFKNGNILLCYERL